LRNVEDSERIKIEFAGAQRVVIIGAGWIGLETASAARTAGLDVTLFVSGELPLAACPRPEVAADFRRVTPQPWRGSALPDHGGRTDRQARDARPASC
jgi:3-phenylpropionate/trans-cinnamate dioxygenase ferredoxin reductase subunit